jgi:hypothetical protein
MDFFVLEIPLLDPLDKEKLLLRPSGKKKFEASIFAQGSTGSTRGTNIRLNLHTWSKLFVRFNLAMGQVVGKLLGWSARSGLGHKINGFHLGQFTSKCNLKETN